MSAQALQQLDFMVSLIDRVSGPAGRIMKTMDTVTTNIQAGYRQIGYGAAGVVGAGFVLDRFTQPARDLNNALREVSSLDVANDALSELTKTSLQFSTKYGEAATSFVASSYDIQSSIDGLVGNELSKFTYAGNVLAKGTKANSDTITDYMGTMYGIFQNNANEMGKGKWVEMLAGQTATAVQIFKTDGKKMADAFGALGANTPAHIAMSEQMAVMGKMQATMGGSQSATRYIAFMDGVGKAQASLGLKFTDTQGRMLPMVQILEAIKGRFGEIDTVAKSDMLTKAFGTKEATALVKLLINDVDGLNASINKIGQQKGMDKAIKMAEAMTDPYAVAGAQIKAIQIMLGKALIPQLLPFLSLMGEGANKILRWTELFPNLTRWVGYGILGVVGLIVTISALSIVMGISKFVMVGWTAAAALMKLAMVPFGPLLVGLRAGWIAMNLSMAAGNGILATAKAGMLAMWGTMKFVALQSKLATAAVWLFNGGLWGMTLALLANPITWIVVGIVALIAAVVAAVVYWDVWTAKIVEWGGKFLEFIGLFSLVDGVLAAWDALPQWWTSFKNWIGTLDPFAFVGDSIDWIIEKINLIPGINIGSVAEAPQPVAAPTSLSVNSESRRRGSVIQRINNANTQNQNRSMGDVVVNNYGRSVNAQTLHDEFSFMAG